MDEMRRLRETPVQRYRRKQRTAAKNRMKLVLTLGLRQQHQEEETPIEPSAEQQLLRALHQWLKLLSLILSLKVKVVFLYRINQVSIFDSSDSISTSSIYELSQKLRDQYLPL